MTLQIKKTTDMKSIYDILEYHKNCLLSLSRGESYRREMAEKFSENAVFISAQVNDTTVGFCAFYANDVSTRTAFISMIAVSSEYRKLGIGQALIDETIIISQKLGMDMIKLEVAEDNEAAIKFYKKNGFKLSFEECINNKLQMIKYM
jgi:Acetyltransferases